MRSIGADGLEIHAGHDARGGNDDADGGVAIALVAIAKA